MRSGKRKSEKTARQISAPTLQRKEGRSRSSRVPAIEIPKSDDRVELSLSDGSITLTNLHKPFWPELGITKRDLLQYYADISPLLLPHLANRAMVMKRYPEGAAGKFFFMKRAPRSRPEWIQTCAIEHASGSVIDFPVIQDLKSLLWVVNLGCIDLNPSYATCDDGDRPDYFHFDLDPVKGADFEQVRETALIIHEALDALKMPNFVKTTGSRGLHIFVPIVRGPTQKAVWGFTKSFALGLEGLRPKLITAEYRIHKRPQRHVLVDYNQNAWGRTLASVYSVRPQARATVSTPITWEEVERGAQTEDFRMDNILRRVGKLGDLWSPLLARAGRVRLDRFL